MSRENKEKKAKREIQGSKESKVRRGRKASRGNKEKKAKREIQGNREFKARRERKAIQEKLRELLWLKIQHLVIN